MVDPIILKISPLTETSTTEDYNNFIKSCNNEDGYIDYMNRICYVEGFAYDNNAPNPDLLTYLKVDFDYDIYDKDNKIKEQEKENKQNKINGYNEEENMENNENYTVIDDKPEYNVIIGYKEDAFDIAKNVLMKPGGLVSIPTETVYGLGCNIYLEESIKRIFKIKKRPLNDPLIVHVYSFDYAIKNLYDVDEIEAELIKYLAKKFTPGPLTIVSKCKKSIPKLLTNGTGYLAVRVPNSQICLELLKYINVPLAAPSANKFGHISPTCPEHVFNEFRGESIYILDGGPCKIGIESTVIKVYKEENNNNSNKGEEKIKETEQKEKEIIKKNNKTCLVEILRKGAVTYEDLKRELEEFKNVKVYEKVKRVERNEKVESPGMLITHYAPNVPTYMVIEENNEINENNKENNINNNKTKEETEGKNKDKVYIDSENIILIDIGSRFKRYSSLFKSYFPVKNDPVIIANQLYSLLRRAENKCINKNNKEINGDKKNKEIKGNKCVIGIYFNEENVDLYSSIYDRLLRATSGNVVYAKEVEGGIEIVRK